MAKYFIALDFDDLDKMRDFVKISYPFCLNYKIGLEITTKFGVKKVLEVLDEFDGLNIFLDLKLHDISNTVCKTIKILTQFKNVKYLTLHASVGLKCLQNANMIRGHIKLLGVSVLTSFDDADCESIYSTNTLNQVKKLGLLLVESGVYGMICSGHEAIILKKDENFKYLKLICPGVRFKDSEYEDQKRVIYIEDCKNMPIDYLVIGRDITKAKDKVAVLKKINILLI